MDHPDISARNACDISSPANPTPTGLVTHAPVLSWGGVAHQDQDANVFRYQEMRRFLDGLVTRLVRPRRIWPFPSGSGLNSASERNELPVFNEPLQQQQQQQQRSESTGKRVNCPSGMIPAGGNSDVHSRQNSQLPLNHFPRRRLTASCLHFSQQQGVIDSSTSAGRSFPSSGGGAPPQEVPE